MVLYFFSLGEALILPKPIRQIIIKNSQKLGINFSSYRKKGKKINDHYFVLSVKVIYITWGKDLSINAKNIENFTGTLYFKNSYADIL